jgi:hypothetical protein
MRELDPDEPLAPQLLGLVLERLEDRLRDAFGGDKYASTSTSPLVCSAYHGASILAASICRSTGSSVCSAAP